MWKIQRKTRAGMYKIYEGVCKDSEVTRSGSQSNWNFERCKKYILYQTSIVSLIWRLHIYIYKIFFYFAGITKQLFPNTDDALIRRMMGQKLNNCTKKPILSKDLNSGAFQKHSFW